MNELLNVLFTVFASFLLVGCGLMSTETMEECDMPTFHLSSGEPIKDFDAFRAELGVQFTDSELEARGYHVVDGVVCADGEFGVLK